MFSYCYGRPSILTGTRALLNSCLPLRYTQAHCQAAHTVFELMQALAQEIACYLGLDLGGIKIKRFADGEIYVQVQASSLPVWLLSVAISSLGHSFYKQPTRHVCVASTCSQQEGLTALVICLAPCCQVPAIRK